MWCVYLLNWIPFFFFFMLNIYKIIDVNFPDVYYNIWNSVMKCTWMNAIICCDWLHGDVIFVWTAVKSEDNYSECIDSALLSWTLVSCMFHILHSLCGVIIFHYLGIHTFRFQLWVSLTLIIHESVITKKCCIFSPLLFVSFETAVLYFQAEIWSMWLYCLIVVSVSVPHYCHSILQKSCMCTFSEIWGKCSFMHLLLFVYMLVGLNSSKGVCESLCTILRV